MTKLRPAFEIELPVGRDEAISRFKESLEHSSWHFSSCCFDRYAELHVPPSELRYWSPHLSLHFDGDDHSTKVFCRLGPRIEIWTFVCVIYLALAFAGFFSLMYCISMWWLGTFTWWCLVPPLTLLGIATLYMVSRIGQGWSRDQMEQLCHASDVLLRPIATHVN